MLNDRREKRIAGETKRERRRDGVIHSGPLTRDAHRAYKVRDIGKRRRQIDKQTERERKREREGGREVELCPAFVLGTRSGTMDNRHEVPLPSPSATGRPSRRSTRFRHFNSENYARVARSFPGVRFHDRNPGNHREGIGGYRGGSIREIGKSKPR